MSTVAAMLRLSDRLMRDGLLRGDQSFLVRAAALRHEAFVRFKEGEWGNALRSFLPAAGKGLAFGAGAAVPAALAGHALISDARNQSHDVLRDARNQTLLTAMGIGGVAAAANRAGNAGRPAPSRNIEWSNTETSPEGLTRQFQARMGSVYDVAKAVIVDDLLEDAIRTGSAEPIDLVVHRVKSASLLEYVP